ncbi:hypothetical protein A3G67_03565 [Candidatus Roizmanbacteria bacterium RIFCSPLOWO2_12_FULL_40_12]|uniref:Type II secretion system protein GspI C-terminal domain-containing protein n=1 Tax=Candidatus Roizmanbacteria bacterium RIFCSPLOWO2_01_FULL_40_42 TaxID=1802066 RepID=A0A1F7J5M9_9BACT|nr:MAG: hypothetical protein A2779_03200 [Candidatus Roizmanbacteria bacterium RIFCSPHIGHO2_01_FULL_40_98]OGK28346.1 MAG: hypothetical protein A3C31_00565 [Candidatus Roizmanbacteria bacterium RIFCSPHIGHO2_02_FULL_40_53]OGK30582.1 MAG: hypothetical protein A2W49_03250 [Candidatus Roizmanbacteria bacterium RIFCSPHIGHO2_12_41_18]OGK36996.1 MAG: hypothetical protein A3E69_00825 [Candidatus Roizmanbacteria bacterium RIFCSPHIGHO2_12_FULL_40_130]OGK50902.1 MAG: hypothetical protein A3B50_01335 [Candi
MKKVSRGFSLVEVLVFVSVLAVFFVVAAAISSVSLRVSKSNENKLRATHYAEELTEWLRGRKEEDWDAFLKNRQGTWCFNNTPLTNWPSSGTCLSSSYLDTIFKREAVISDPVPNDDQLNVSVTVSWSEAANTFNVPLKTVFSRFE